MKRSLFITIAVLIVMALFVGCKADIADRDELGTVSITEVSRSLDSSAVLTVDAEDLCWFYTAVKADNSIFVTGATGTTKTPVKTGAVAGLAGANLGKFSIGAWTFCFYGYYEASIENGEIKTDAKPVYYQEGMAVTVSKNVSAYLTVTLTQGEGMAKPKVAISGATWTYELAGEGKALTLKVYDGEFDATNNDENLLGDPIAATTDANGTATFSTAADFELTAGDHTLYFYVYYPANENQLVGQTPLQLSAKAGLKYTITDLQGTASGIEVLNEEGAIYISGSYNPDAQTATATGTITVSPTVETVVQAGVAPVETKQTTVTFPAGSFETAGDQVLTIAVADTAAAAETNFVVTNVDTTGAPIAVLSFSLSNAPATFGDEAVEVETFIQPGLDADSIKVIYNGTSGAQPTDVAYDPLTGRLTFKTTHFSDYVVVYTKAVASIGNVLYETIEAAVAGAASGDTIVVLSNTSLSATYVANDGKTIVLDLNGKTVAGNWDVYEYDITFKNGTINGIVHLNGLDNDGSKCHVTIAADAIVKGNYLGNDVYGIILWEKYQGVTGYGMLLDVYGRLDECIWVLGNITEGDSVINIRNGAVINGSELGIALNGLATLNVEAGASITGVDSAIEVRAGNLNIVGGTFVATSTVDPVASNANGSGSTTKGAAIAIAQHTTRLPINVVIDDGSFTGTRALFFSDPEDGDAVNVSITVNGGSFNGVENIDVFDFTAGATYTLAGVRDAVNEGTASAGNFMLVRDVNLAGVAWTPIGTKEHPFTGVFDGQNHKINNLTINEPNGTYLGLFGYVGGGNTTIKNVKLSKVSISAKKRIAGLIAEIIGDATIYNCSIDAESTITGSDANIAGLIGEIYPASDSTIICEKLNNYATIIGTGAPLDCRVAGICCQSTNGNNVKNHIYFTDCHNYGNVTASGAFAGGITCSVQGPDTVEVFDNCSNSGQLTGEYTGDLNAWLTGNKHEIVIKNYSGDVSKALGALMHGSHGNVYYVEIEGVLYAYQCIRNNPTVAFGSLYSGATQIDKSLFDDFRSFAAYVIEHDPLGRSAATRNSTGTSTDEQIFYNAMYPSNNGEQGNLVSNETSVEDYLNPIHALEHYNADNGTNWEISKFKPQWTSDTLYKII